MIQKGLNFAVVPEKPPINEVIQAPELACKQLENDTAAELRARVANVLKTTRLPPSNITKEERKALADLKKDQIF